MRILFWVVVVALCILPLLTTINLWRVWRSQTTTTQNSTPAQRSNWSRAWRDKWKSALLFLVGLVACHITVAYYFGKFYELLASHSIFWVAHGVGLYAFFSRKEVVKRGKKEIEYPILTKILIAIVLIVGGVDAHDTYKAYNPSLENSGFSKPQTKNPLIDSSQPTSPLPPLNEKGAKLAREAFTAAGLSPVAVQEMVDICQRESGCNQFEADGKTVLTGRVNRNDKGLYQINLDWLNAEIEKYGSDNPELKEWDVETTEGNLKVAVYYRQKYGLLPWKATAVFKEAFSGQKIVTTAPLAKDGWVGEIIPINGQKTGIWIYGNVKFRDEHGREQSAGPNSKIELGRVQSLQFLSMEDSPMTVVVKFVN